MNIPLVHSDHAPGPRRGGLRRGSQALLMVMLVLPAAAYPLGLNDLLRMPLEHLMRLQISATRSQ
jgi:hypothetical protein